MIFRQQRQTGVASWTVGLSLVSALSNQRCTLSGAEIRLWNVNSKTVKTEQRRRDAGVETWNTGWMECHPAQWILIRHKHRITEIFVKFLQQSSTVKRKMIIVLWRQTPASPMEIVVRQCHSWRKPKASVLKSTRKPGQFKVQMMRIYKVMVKSSN